MHTCYGPWFGYPANRHDATMTKTIEKSSLLSPTFPSTRARLALDRNRRFPSNLATNLARNASVSRSMVSVNRVLLDPNKIEKLFESPPPMRGTHDRGWSLSVGEFYVDRRGDRFANVCRDNGFVNVSGFGSSVRNLGRIPRTSPKQLETQP